MKLNTIVSGLLFMLFTFFLKEGYANDHKLIVVLIDGVRWNYINDPKLKGFNRIINSGVKAQYVVPIYPSLSYPNWYSIVTGLNAENHGFLSNIMYDEGTKTFYLMNPDKNATLPFWWNEAEPIWITAEKNNKSAAMYWWGGCQVRIKEHHPMICERERYGPPTPEEKEDFIERIDDMIEMFKPSKRFKKDRLSLALMYYGSTDYAGHKYGTASRELKEALFDIDDILDKMQSKLEKAGLKDDVNIMIVSDHGMTDLIGTHYVDLDRFSENIKYQVSHGTESMIVPKDGMLDKLYSDLKAANIKGIEIYKKEEIPTRYHIKQGKRMTPLYLIAHKGFFIQGLSNMKKNVQKIHKTAAQHGYDPAEEENMRTIFLATGPDFEKGKKIGALNITDLYNVMCHILHLNALPNNGSWESVKYMLKENNLHPHLKTRAVSSSVVTVQFSLFGHVVLTIMMFKLIIIKNKYI